jgi:Ca2+-binding EF-hand superfamily protein
VIRGQELANFLKSSFVRVSAAEAGLVVREYDADQDGCLDFTEFCRMVLPATNPILTQIAMNRSSNE